MRNELQIASETAKKLSDSNFIIPLRLGAFEAPFLVAHAQYIDFEQSWAAGLTELLETLEETYRVPKATGNIETRSLIAAFCRLAKSLSCSQQMGWSVGAVGIEL